MPTIDVTIEKLIYGGEGLAHHDGATVFVPFVLPAERVAVSPVERKKKFVRARMDEVLSPSPARIEALCPHFGACGGCDYQHIPYDAQLIFKTEILRETLRRLGRIDWTGAIAAHASQPFGYRNRAQWRFRTAGEETGETKSGGGNALVPLSIGYFRPNSSALCAIHECPILSPALQSAFVALRDAAAAAHLPRALREIEAFAASPSEAGSESRLLVTATFAGYPSQAPELAKTFREIIPNLESLVFHDPGRDRMELFGPGFAEHHAAGRSFRVGHFSFFQVNDSLVDELARCAIGADESQQPADSTKLALDLFAGVGLFTLPLAERFARVVAVESNPAAARDLEFNVRTRANVEVRSADVERFLEKYKEKPDLVLLDPPRAGLEPSALQRLARLAPDTITYVSCEPPTLARDLAVLISAGYSISELHLVDLFPQTFHMEAIARLRRSR
jgi:23S rRNA (uracil1939-C5)-methyltransferase